LIILSQCYIHSNLYECYRRFLELELRKGKEYHKNAIGLNTGRNALEYILLANKYTKIFIPYFFCDVLLQPLQKLNLEYEFYTINESFEAIFDFQLLKENEAFLYINYFGLKDDYIRNLTFQCKNFIVDNTQAFFSRPIKNIDTFYSSRKFFGLPDGAYLYSNNLIDKKLSKDLSYKRCAHLLRRIDDSPENAYSLFKENENLLNNVPLLEMSELTRILLQGINYAKVRKIRRDNFLHLQKRLNKLNKIQAKLNLKQVPLTYPFFSDIINLKEKLIENRIFITTYWPNVLKLAKNTAEYKFAAFIVHLPIDQRYNIKDMDIIINIIKRLSNKS
jgi:hypothetical protein